MATLNQKKNMMDPILKVKIEYATVLAIAILFVLLWVAVIVYFFTNIYNGGPEAGSRFGFRYVIVGTSLFFVGVMVLRAGVPMFIPLKQTSRHLPVKTCAHCGAIIKDDKPVCEKCQQPIQDTE